MIIKETSSGELEHFAFITDNNYSKYKIVVGNLDQFMAKIVNKGPNGETVQMVETVEYRTRNKTAKILMAGASFMFCVCGIGYFAFSLMNSRKASSAT